VGKAYGLRGNLSRRHSEALEAAKGEHCHEEPLLFSRIGAIYEIRYLFLIDIIGLR
jgi:hypothetical protein